MLDCLDIEAFRGFAGYEIGGLRRFNLFVGKNGCGKSSALEAVPFLVSNDRIDALAQAAWNRREFIVDSARHASDLGSCFRDGGWVDGSAVEVRGTPGPWRARAVFEPVGRTSSRGLAAANAPGGASHPLAISVTGETNKETFEECGHFDSDRGLRGSTGQSSARRDSGPYSPPPVRFLGPSSKMDESFAAAWNSLVVGKRENEVLDAMRLLYPEVKSILPILHRSALVGDATETHRGPGAVSYFVDLGDARRMHIKALGDGVERIALIASWLSVVEGGVLLLDEVDTGLHHTVHARLFSLIVALARTVDAQVFATTHSLDCLRGLADACEEDAALAADVAVHKIDPSLLKAVTFDAAGLAYAMATDGELRG